MLNSGKTRRNPSDPEAMRACCRLDFGVLRPLQMPNAFQDCGGADDRELANAGRRVLYGEPMSSRFAVPVIHRQCRRICRVKAYVTTRCACNLLPPVCLQGQQWKAPIWGNTMGQSKIKKRSMIISGHKTSVSLEDEFWDELRALASERRVPVATLVNEIDQATEGNLSSAIRVYLLMRAQRRSRAA